MYKKTMLAGLITLLSSASYAVPVILDGDGAGVNSGRTIGGLDWAASSILTTPTRGNVLGGTSSGNAAAPNAGDILQSYTHGALSGVTNASGRPVALGGLNDDYEITFVAGFQEYVSNFTGSVGLATIELTTIGGGDNFFKIFSSSSINSNQLAGTGFSDGTLILSGSVLAASGGRGKTTFTTTGEQATLDQFGTDNYAGKKSVVGQGSGTVDVLVSFVNTAYFTDLDIGSSISLFLDSQINDPFKQTDPSSCYTQGNGLLTNGPGLASGGVGCAGDAVGINGINGPRLILQTDATSSFQHTVPEPTSLALAGLALSALSLARRRKA